MSMQELQKYTFVSKYARYNKTAGRRETWDESVTRMRDMHLRKYPNAANLIHESFESVYSQEVLGSQRALQYGGLPIERINERSYNCTASFCDRLRFFQEGFFLLLAGCGVGFSVQKHHVAKLPQFCSPRLNRLAPTLPRVVHKVGDSIEGWADALGVLLSSYFENPVFDCYYGCEVSFDYSDVRDEGSDISSGSGKAPGPEPLRKSLELVRGILDRCISQGLKRLRPIHAYDILMHVSDAVLSGGVRRSATIALFSLDDDEMMEAKTGNWYYENPQRARSNNSVLLVRGQVTKEQFKAIVERTRQFGEPGFVWADDTECVYNPCFHGDTRILTENGYRTIRDLAETGLATKMVVDARVGKDDEVYMDRSGMVALNATPARLTRKDAELFEVVTSHGHSIKTTADHWFPTTEGRKRMRDLCPGDTLFLQSDEGAFGTEGSWECGFLLGLITGDGTISDEGKLAFIDIWEEDFSELERIKAIVASECSDLAHADHRKGVESEWNEATKGENKRRVRLGGRRLWRLLEEKYGISNPAVIKNGVPECVWRGSRDCVRGYLQGLNFANGSIQVGGTNLRGNKLGPSLRIGQSNQSLLREVQSLFGNFGVVGRIRRRRDAGWRSLPDGHLGRKMHWCDARYEIVVNRPNMIRTVDRIGLFGRNHVIANAVLADRGRECRRPERFLTTVKSVQSCGRDDVYCLTQPQTNTVTASGCVVGQCVEVALYPVDWLTGLTGWEMCNLSTINGKKVVSREDFYRKCRHASIIGTLQAGYTRFPYLGEVSERICEREALIGVSITGMMENPDILLNESVLADGARVVIKTNAEVASVIGINPTARGTVIKPEGSASCLLGTSSGIHLHHARRFFRRVQANCLEAPYQFFSKFNPDAVSPSMWSASSSDGVISFCCEVGENALIKGMMGAVDFLDKVLRVKRAWIDNGKVQERCVRPCLSHNVSNTVNVHDHEWADVIDFIYENRNDFAGISLLSHSGDLDYPQAPFTAVKTADEMASSYGRAFDDELVPKLVLEASEAIAGGLWKAVDIASGLQDPMSLREEDWKRSFLDFAAHHFSGDVRRAGYCLKDFWLYCEWLKLTASYAPVEYLHMAESEDSTMPQLEAACAGGACVNTF